jgi:hypothetical protein
VFWLVAAAGAVVGLLVASLGGRPWLGAIVCGLVGALVGAAVSALLVVWPAVRALWHWSGELLALAAVGLLARMVALLLGSWWWALLLLAPAVVVAAVPTLRRRARGRVWCLVVRHRLRVAFAAFVRANNRQNAAVVPLILWVRPTPAGERAWVWLRTGLDVVGLETQAGLLAVTCWASGVQLTPSRRFAALVRLDITRRDALRPMVASGLPALIPVSPALAPTAAEGGWLALDLDDVPETVNEPVSGRVRPGRAA